MVRFTFLRPSTASLAPEYRAQFLTIRRLIRWEIADPSGKYSGLLILGEQIMGSHAPPPGFLPTASMTIDLDGQEIPESKARELSLRVNGEFFGSGMGWDVVSFESNFRVQ